jgi:ubiquinone/menaquinone biosynthesis C-methylase UbiE
MIETTTAKPEFFSSDGKSALEALAQAQFIAFAPYVFQASVILRDSNILKEIEAHRQGITIDELAGIVEMSVYAVRVLLEAGLGIGLVYQKDDKFFLAKTGHFFLNDTSTRINTNFMRDVCYDGAQDIGAALRDGKPHGLKRLGDWETIHQGLSIMPEPARTSWFNFNHYYSGNVFPAAMPIIFEGKSKKIMDIGANTGRFSLTCLEYCSEAEVCLVDLPVQLNVAREFLKEAGHTNRVHFFDCDVLDKNASLPEGYDVIWMSQFLDNFSEDQVIDILGKCHKVLNEGGRIFISETFWDRQRFEASAFSLQMTSLYFTSMANGNSQMYAYELFSKLIDKAGFTIVKQTDNIGLTHSILEVRKK